MRILYVGDIMGKPGIDVVDKVLPGLKKEQQVDIVIAQAENVTDGKSMTVADMKSLQALGIDFFTGGNHTPKEPELWDLLRDDTQPVIGPANLESCPGKGWKYINTPKGRVFIVSLLGATVGKEIEIKNPLQTIDQILAVNQEEERVATIIDFHGDFSSEKIIIGYYLDGRVTAVVGDHWHVPTADAMVLPKGTAHITDVGMCGVLHSSLGVTFDSVIPRWRDGIPTKNILEFNGPLQFNAVLIESDDSTGLATSIRHIQQIIG